MKIYLVSRKDEVNYDEYDSIIVAAETEEEARSMHPEMEFNRNCWKEEEVYGTWIKEKDINNKLEVTYIGIAKPGTKKGVLLASFNAG